MVKSNKHVIREVRLQTSNKLRPCCDEMTNTHLSVSLEIPLPDYLGGVSSRSNLKIATKLKQVATNLRLKFSQMIIVLIGN